MAINANGKSGRYTTGWGDVGSPVNEKYAAAGMLSRNNTAKMRCARRQPSVFAFEA
jgi:hypothetical protein